MIPLFKGRPFRRWQCLHTGDHLAEPMGQFPTLGTSLPLSQKEFMQSHLRFPRSDKYALVIPNGGGSGLQRF